MPYGNNVEGIESAALSYFGHRANRLTSAEIATLLAVPQNPQRRFPSPANKKRLTKARGRVLRRLVQQGVLPRQALSNLSSVPSKLKPFPRHIPHAARFLRRLRHGPLETTLQRGVQKVARRVFQAARARLQNLGIHNGALVVLEHDTAQIRALVGNFDFWDTLHGGQIVGFNVPRSPGSALKPLIYAMGLEQGLVLPEHLVLDIPTRFGGYLPKNYDGRFSGMVRIEDALSRSLNVPFVRLLHRVGIESFVSTMRMQGVQSLHGAFGYYGLSAAIGGLELTPLELVGLYGTLARNGQWTRSRMWRDEQEGPRTRIFSPGVSFLTKRALRLKDRPDFPARRRFTGVPPSIFWKTGTSYGHRDAWAVGAYGKYTAVVWLGNFDNRPSVHLVGSEAAGPVLFDVLEGLAPGRFEDAEDVPLDLKAVSVCAFSGRLPGPGCRHQKRVHALTKNVPTETCPYHVELDIDTETGLALTPGCQEQRPSRKESFLRLPSRLRRWRQRGSGLEPHAPAYLPACQASLADAPPKMTSPQQRQLALLLPGLPAESQEIPLIAESTGARLSWFVDGEYLGTVSAEQPFWWTPREGAHEIVVVDEVGRSDRRVLRVKHRL